MERGEDEHAGTLRAALADHGKASSVDIQRRDVHSQYLLVIDDPRQGVIGSRIGRHKRLDYAVDR